MQLRNVCVCGGDCWALSRCTQGVHRSGYMVSQNSNTSVNAHLFVRALPIHTMHKSSENACLVLGNQTAFWLGMFMELAFGYRYVTVAADVTLLLCVCLSLLCSKSEVTAQSRSSCCHGSHVSI